MMTKPEVTMQINLGTLIPIGIALISLATWTGSLGTKVDSLEQDVETVQTTVQGYDSRLRAIEVVQTGVNVRLDGIGDSIVEIKDGQKEINNLLRQYLRNQP